MVRAGAILRGVVCAWLLGAAVPAAAESAETFSPDAASYDALGSQERKFELPASYARADERKQAVPSSRQQVMDAIWKAAEHTGVDYNYLVAQAHLESGLNAQAKARTSSAAGLFQFIETTWLTSLKRYESQIEGSLGQYSQSSGDSRAQKLEWRHDAELASLVAAAYAQDNAKRLERVLGRPARRTELYLAHFLGGGGASRFMQAWKQNSGAAAASLFPKAARANRSIFYTRQGQARSLAQVLNHFDRKINRALVGLGIEVEKEQIQTQNQSSMPHTSMAFSTMTVTPDKLLFGMDVGVLSLAKHNDVTTSGIQSNVTAKSCNHIAMCYGASMNTSTITQVRDLIETGAYTKAGIARAAGLHANTLRDASEADWNPTAETLAKLQRFLDANDDTPVLVGAEEIIDEARNGRMYILVDDEDRENEGDLIIPAQMATPAAVNFMATHGRGLICLALDKARVDALGLDPMSRNNRESMQTAFTVSIEAKEGVTTGISAADRARTIAVAIDATKGPDDIVTPGHVFPLVAREGGTLVRAGHTEAAVDISRLAGLNPSGVICEIMNEDGSMARLDDLIDFARKHDMKIGTIRDLIAYRMRNDHLVERIGESTFESDYGGQWRMITYRNTITDNEAYVLQKGHVSPDEPTLARVHPISVFDDVLGAPGPRKRTLQRAMGAIGEKGAGVIVILTQRVGTSGKWTADEEHRNIGIGSQILADLGVHEMVLLSNSRPDFVALEGYGITLTGHQEIPE